MGKESFHMKRSQTCAGTVSDLLHDLTFEFYKTRQIGLDLCTDFQQNGPVDMEWLKNKVDYIGHA